jgi:hypothetical protein
MILGGKPAGPMGCFDNKFEIHFRTQRSKVYGRGMVDDLDVEIRNKNLDGTCLVGELSAVCSGKRRHQFWHRHLQHPATGSYRCVMGALS